MANEIKLFAGPSTNTLTPAAWAALTSLLANGFGSGLASSQQANTLFRQLSTVAAGVGQFISDQGFDALDNGDMNAFAAALASAIKKAALPSGIILMSGAGTVPAGTVKLNGAVIPIDASSAALVSAVYCGNANNATAEFFYKCTNPASPSASRSTAGTYFVLEDTRGRFPRSWTDGGSLDAGRSLWAMQAASAGSFTLAADANGGEGGGGANRGVTKLTLNSVNVVDNGSGFGTVTVTPSDTRGFNFPCLFSITL